MVNPISSIPGAGFPAISFPFTDPSGIMSIYWYQILLALYNRTGGAAGVDLTAFDSAIRALIVGVEDVATLALAANTSATHAQDTANTAVTDAITAQGTANAATAVADNALARAANLSDLTSAVTARSNLGVDSVPLVFSFPAAPAASLYLPITQNITVAASFNGTVTYAAFAPTANATFTLSVLHGAYGLTIGTITLVAGSNTGNVKGAIASYPLFAGDILKLDAPIVPDATLSNVTFTFRTIL